MVVSVPKNLIAIELDKVSYQDPQLKGAQTVFVDMDQKVVHPDQLFLCLNKSNLANLQREDATKAIETYMELKSFEKPLDNYYIYGRAIRIEFPVRDI